ncbi:MAG: disulfide bond formation protein DsbA, partial [Candidatus Electrothrix sp. AR3]|nr:disulfide bond formation protein DsbA [Candidatus Electrothrix sp. AR3]
FKIDWESASTKEKLTKDMNAARKADVNGTPTLFVNGRRVKSPSYAALQKMIDSELAKKK